MTVAIAQVECLAGRNARYVIGQKPYDGSEILETSAAVSEARFTRYNEIRKQSREIQTSAASYGWLLASIKMSWYLRYHGWKKLTAPVLLFQAEKDAFVSVRAIQKFAKKLQRKGRFSFFVTPISDFFESSEIGSRVSGDIGLPTLEHTSPFRHSTMRKGRKKRALRIAEKLLVRLLTQCSHILRWVAGALDEVISIDS